MTDTELGAKMLPLSDREAEILKRLSQGDGNKMIASGMGLSQATVKNHTVNMKHKLGAFTQAHAVYIGMKEHIIE